MPEYMVGEIARINGEFFKINAKSDRPGLCKYTVGYTDGLHSCTGGLPKRCTDGLPKPKFVYFINEATKTYSETHPEGCYDLSKLDMLFLAADDNAKEDINAKEGYYDPFQLGNYYADNWFVINFESDGIPIIMPKVESCFVAVNSPVTLVKLKEKKDKTDKDEFVDVDFKRLDSAKKSEEKLNFQPPDSVTKKAPTSSYARANLSLYRGKPLGYFHPLGESRVKAAPVETDNRRYVAPKSRIFEATPNEAETLGQSLTAKTLAMPKNPTRAPLLPYVIESLNLPGNQIPGKSIEAGTTLRFKVSTSTPSTAKRALRPYNLADKKFLCLKGCPSVEKLYARLKTTCRHNATYLYSVDADGDFTPKELKILKKIVFYLSDNARMREYKKDTEISFARLEKELNNDHNPPPQQREATEASSSSRQAFFDGQNRKRKRGDVEVPSAESNQTGSPSPQ